MGGTTIFDEFEESGPFSRKESLISENEGSEYEETSSADIISSEE